MNEIHSVKETITILIAFMCLQANAQNLVPNPSFESHGPLLCTWTQYDYEFADEMPQWTMPTRGSTDIFSTLVSTSCYSHCFSTHSSSTGQQQPRTGEIMAGMWVYGNGCSANYREYLEVQLTSPLIVGETYYAEMFVSHADYTNTATNNMGMYFSDTYITAPNICSPLNLTPLINEISIITDSINWVKISGTFIATSPAQFLVIGNFYDDDGTSVVFYPTNSTRHAMYYVDDVTVRVKCKDLSSNINICPGDTVSLVSSITNPLGWVIANSPGVLISSDPILTVSPEQTTTYLTFNNCDSSAITVIVLPPLSLDLGADITLCDGETISLYPALPNAVYVWQDSSVNEYLDIMEQGVYWVEATDGCEIVSDTITVNYNPLPVVDVGRDTVLCEGSEFTLDVTTSNAIYLWKDNSTSPTLVVKQPGNYWVDVTVDNCTERDSIYISYIPAPIVDFGDAHAVCAGESITLDATNISASYVWQDNSISSSLTIWEPGIYWAEVINICGAASDTASIQLVHCACLLCVPDAFSPNAIGIDVNNKLYIFYKLDYAGDALESLNFRIYNRWGELIFEASEASQIVYPEGGWDGTHMRSGKEMEVGVYVWSLEAKTISGTRIAPVSGNVSLIR